MKEVATLLLFVLFFSNVLANDYTNESLIVTATLIEPIAEVRIGTDRVDFGEITAGYETETRNLSITNIGSLDVRVKATLDKTAEDIFEYLKFSTASCSSWSNISKWSGTQILSHADIYGEEGEKSYFCMKLDLTDFDEEISFRRNISTEIIFWVMPA